MAVFYGYDVDDGALLREAADRIDALEAEVERLEDLADTYLVTLMRCAKDAERLRVLLADAKNTLWDAVDSGYAAPKSVLAALAGEGDEDESITV
jgi:hypothetical protein